jgi:DNA processing protein
MKLDWLRLYRSENVGPATFFRLLERFGSPARALAALPDLARRGGGRKPIGICPPAAAEAELAAIERLGAHLVVSDDPAFPPALRPLWTAPLIIVRGNLGLLQRPAVAIVGARNASAVGRRMAAMLAGDLSRSGFLVVSGLARGIDGAAHAAALAGGTAAILAGGVDVVYPPEHRDLYRDICATGCAVSEMPLGTQPQASHFPRRNRLISGIALGVVVVEASPRSGSLITAQLAVDQGREVFAVPGCPLDPRCQGPNGLIRQGAQLTESAADVLDVLGHLLDRPSAEPCRTAMRPVAPPPEDDAELAEARRLVARSLGGSPVPVDEILRQCQLSPAVMSTVLLELDLAGRLERHPGNQVSLLP